MRDGRVVKGVRFRNHRDVGDIVELAARYCGAGADELVFYDISASPEGRRVDRAWIDRVARILDIPFCVAGGIRSIEDAERTLASGADKISINSPALADPELITAMAERFGSQCVVIGIDSYVRDGRATVRELTGDPNTDRSTGRSTLDWVHEVQARGAGEIVLNCMNQDGVRDGYDVDQLAAVRQASEVPLVASGGAGSMQHFAEVFQLADVDGALAASVFHDGLIEIAELKNYLQQNDVDVRPAPAGANA